MICSDAPWSVYCEYCVSGIGESWNHSYDYLLRFSWLLHESYWLSAIWSIPCFIFVIQIKSKITGSINLKIWLSFLVLEITVDRVKQIVHMDNHCNPTLFWSAGNQMMLRFLVHPAGLQEEEVYCACVCASNQAHTSIWLDDLEGFSALPITFASLVKKATGKSPIILFSFVPCQLLIALHHAQKGYQVEWNMSIVFVPKIMFIRTNHITSLASVSLCIMSAVDKMLYTSCN